MGLSSILSTATTGLQVIEAEIQWRTDNVNNINSTTYARRDPVTVSTSVHGVTATITRASDTALASQVIKANSASSAASTTSSYFSQIGDVLGTSTSTSTSTLQTDMDNFTSAWQGYESDTSASTSEAQVVSNGQTLAQDMTSEARQLQQLGEQASASAGDQVTTLNTKLSALGALNTQLSANPQAATTDPSLLDQRDSLVNDISGIVGVNVVTHSDGSVGLYTQNGTVLVDKTANQFQWNASTGGTQAYVSIAGISSSTPGLNSGFSGGTLGATLNFLNPSTSSSDPAVGTLAKAQAQLDNLALQLSGQATGTFGGAYYSATADRSTDLAGGTSPATKTYAAYGSTSAATAAGWNGTSLSSFFTIDNGSTTGPTAPSESPSQSLAVNAALVDGSATVKRESATAVVAALTSTTRTMTTGGVNVTNKTYSGLAAAIANYQSTSESAASTSSTTLSAATTTLQTRLSSEIGVNSDTEMAQLTVLENDYSANAKVISTVQSMFDTLLNIAT